MGMGRKITDLEDLFELSRMKRAVICPDNKPRNKPIPAAVVMNMSGGHILRVLRKGL